MSSEPASLVDRLLSWRVVSDVTGCWLSKRCYSFDEYFRITYGGEKQLIHRLSAIAYLNLDAATNMQANHKPICPFKACFNPEHLYVGTAKENSQDYSNSKTHCKNGHLLDISNAYIVKLRHGARKGQYIINCRECGKLNARKYRGQ